MIGKPSQLEFDGMVTETKRTVEVIPRWKIRFELSNCRWYDFLRSSIHTPTTERERDSKNGFLNSILPPSRIVICINLASLSLISIINSRTESTKERNCAIEIWNVCSPLLDDYLVKIHEECPLEACTYDVHTEGDQEISLFWG